MQVPRWLSRLRPSPGMADMSFLDHLDELRSVLLSCLGILLVLTVAAWFVSGMTLDFLVAHTIERAQFIKPLEAFMTRMKLALLMAFTVGLPFISFQIWSFVVPGLMKHERRLVIPLVVWSTTLFLIGVAFSALALTPTMLRILMSFATEAVQPAIAVGYLFDFFVKMAIACGILFQLPLVIAVLSLAGLVTPELLKAKWRHAIVMILIVAAVVTPGDGPSQLVLAVPIVLLYFVSIWVSTMIYRRKRGAEDTPDEGDDPEDRDDEGAPDEGDDPEDRDDEGAPDEGDRPEDRDDEGTPGEGGRPEGRDEGAPGEGGGSEDRDDEGAPGGESPAGGASSVTGEVGSPEQKQEPANEEGRPRPLHPPEGDWSI